MLADGSAQRASIQDLTDAADVGFGSFYNHFTGKDDLFIAAVTDVLEETGELLNRLNRELDDPAAGYARSVRLSVLGALRRPQIAQILVRHGLSYLTGDHGLTPRILLDITAAVEAGRFQVENPQLAVGATLGAVLATLQLALTDPDFAAQPVDEQLAEHLLRMFGLPPDEARDLSRAPLPNRGRR